VTDPDLDRRAAALFEAVVEFAVDERRRVLDTECGDDARLRNRVERLLHFHGAETGDLFPSPLQQPPLHAGQVIGPYRVVSLIGEGGMGAVYLAERLDVELKVALKVVRNGVLAAPGHVRRFMLERRILARLDNPAISRLVDAGATTDGIPYLVMEYVEGERLDRYADRHRLTIQQRIELFTAVCDAVAYAHRALVVHRDLKPSNILLTPDGQVRLLDFGVAKLLDPEVVDSELTLVGPVPLTPEYASPEQVRGEPVTTASDVYALGVILYELLAGTRPYRIAGSTSWDIERAVCTTEPCRPSAVIAAGARGHPPAEPDLAVEAVSRSRRTRPAALARELRGDLDTIVLKAMAKDPDRRYHSALELGDDLRRHLAGRPVRARPDSHGYRLRKLVARNRVIVGGAVVTATVAIVGAAMTLRSAAEAQRQRELALASASTMVFELADGLRRMTGPTDARLGLLTRATAIFEVVAAAGPSTPESRRQMADGYRMLGQTHRVLGDLATARRFARLAEGGARHLATGPAATDADRLLLADALIELGDVLAAAGTGGAATHFAEAISIVDGITGDGVDYARLHRVRYLATSRLADRLLEQTGAQDSAGVLYGRAHAAAGALLRHDSGGSRALTYYATTLERLADSDYGAGMTSQACERYRAALATRNRAVAAAPGDPEVRRARAVSLHNVAWCHDQEGHGDEALRLYREANDGLRALLRDDPSNVVVAVLLVGGVGELGNALRARGDVDASLDAYRDAVSVGETFRGRGIHEARLTWKTAQVAQLYADALLAAGAPAAAAEVLGATRQLLGGLLARSPEHVEYLRSHTAVLKTESAIRARGGDLAGALDLATECLAARMSLAQRTGLPEERLGLADAYHDHALALQATGRTGDARQQLLEARRILLELRDAELLTDGASAARRSLAAIELALQRLTG
jgi:eukaryotic-like serine/threonine-protein kinase